VKYAVGQPMGALSSWAMLAITHHYILQYANLQVLKNKVLELRAEGFSASDASQRAKDYLNWVPWTDAYEILGDDLVIIDSHLAAQYLVVAKDLGVEINLSKSISSNNGSFEFAKRTVISGSDVSGVQWKVFLDYGSLPTVVNAILKYISSGVNITEWMLAVLSSNKGCFWEKSAASLESTRVRLRYSLIAVMGHYAGKGALPLSWFACWLMNPLCEFKANSEIPILQTVRYLNWIQRSLSEKALVLGSGKATDYFQNLE
jgi:hypothetical protein